MHNFNMVMATVSDLNIAVIVRHIWPTYAAQLYWLEEFNWHWSVATPPLEPQAPGRIEE